MYKIRLAAAAVIAGIFLTLTSGLAHAADDPYPVDTPTPTVSPSIAPAEAAVDADNNGVLPDTGGGYLSLALIGGALVLVGGGVTYVARRKHSAH